MHGQRNLIVLGISVFAIASAAIALGPKPAVRAAKPTYASIAGIMKNCAGCHQGPAAKHGLNLTNYAMLMKGDKEGKVVVPGNPAASRLSKSIHRKGAAPMPPVGPLPASDVAKIDAWIKAGAKK